MQQRRLRLGDILDDYCPRERRITNHAVVAMIEDEVKQTRCTTCDADHEYKQARLPARRKKDPAGILGDLVMPARPRPTAAAMVDEPPADDLIIEDELSTSTAEQTLPEPAFPEPDAAGDDEDDAPPRGEEDGPVHRRLIRATLPRPEGQTPEWKEPDFTIRQPGGGRGGFDGNRNGQRPERGRARGARGPVGNAPGNQARFGGPRHGGNRAPGGGQGNGNRAGRPGQGPGHGQGQSRGPRPGGHGRKRGR